MKEYLFNVEDEYEGERLDRYITLSLQDFSRSFIQKLVSEGNISVNQKSCKSGNRVKAGDEIRVITPDAVVPDILPVNIPLDILYEDDDLLVVNKPKNMVVHPAPGHFDDTLVNAVMYHCGDNLSGINGVMRPGIVHRIDKDTTGSIIVCKNDVSHEKIAAQLKEHQIHREYWAVVSGVINEKSGTIDKPIGRMNNDRKKMCVNASVSKRAVTHYEVLENYDKYTLVKCILETGRTHQIRVHMASIGHPVAGDELYGNNIKPPIETYGQALHAKILGFVHPKSGIYIETDAPLPEYFTKLLKILKKDN